jgi:hypothetical protein
MNGLPRAAWSEVPTFLVVCTVVSSPSAGSSMGTSTLGS